MAFSTSPHNVGLLFNLSCLLQVYRHSYMASYSIYNIHTR